MLKNRLNLLIVDDNRENVKVAASSLSDIPNVSLAFATDGAKALTSLKNQDIDLVLMDVNMPLLDGYETVRLMKENPALASIPVIFVTADSSDESVMKAFDCGGVDYITKPFNAKELRARVMTQLQLRDYNKNLEKLIEEKSRELEESLIRDKSSGAYNASKLCLDLSFERKRVATMLTVKNIRQLELSFGLDAVDSLLGYLVHWIDEHRSLEATTYRISFAEFICVFEIDDMDEVEKCCLNLQREIADISFEIFRDSRVHLSTVISVAKGNQMELLRHLRIAQLEAEMRNLSFCRFKEESIEILKQQEKNLQWIGRLKESFEKDTLIPFFQPIVDSTSGKIVRYEALARIKEGDEIITPFHFIEAAKQLSAITEITKRMLVKSFKIFAGLSVGFSVNITKEDLNESYLSLMLKNLCQEYAIAPSMITLEVLEDISVFGSDKVVEELIALKNAGYKIALDDFGSENASFSRMLALELDYLKIDGIFIKNIHTDTKSYKIVEGIVRLADSMGYEVVAEFVHSKEVADVVKRLGIKYMQGYYYSPPIENPRDLLDQHA